MSPPDPGRILLCCQGGCCERLHGRVCQAQIVLWQSLQQGLLRGRTGGAKAAGDFDGRYERDACMQCPVQAPWRAWFQCSIRLHVILAAAAETCQHGIAQYGGERSDVEGRHAALRVVSSPEAYPGLPCTCQRGASVAALLHAPTDIGENFGICAEVVEAVQRGGDRQDSHAAMCILLQQQQLSGWHVYVLGKLRQACGV